MHWSGATIYKQLTKGKYCFSTSARLFLVVWLFHPSAIGVQAVYGIAGPFQLSNTASVSECANYRLPLVHLFVNDANTGIQSVLCHFWSDYITGYKVAWLVSTAGTSPYMCQPARAMCIEGHRCHVLWFPTWYIHRIGVQRIETVVTYCACQLATYTE